jgi:hypothetical protein
MNNAKKNVASDDAMDGTIARPSVVSISLRPLWFVVAPNGETHYDLTLDVALRVAAMSGGRVVQAF